MDLNLLSLLFLIFRSVLLYEFNITYISFNQKNNILLVLGNYECSCYEYLPMCFIKTEVLISLGKIHSSGVNVLSGYGRWNIMTLSKEFCKVGMLFCMMFGCYKHCLHFSAVAKSCPTLCNPVDCSMPGLLVFYQQLNLAQAHVH